MDEVNNLANFLRKNLQYNHLISKGKNINNNYY